MDEHKLVDQIDNFVINEKYLYILELFFDEVITGKYKLSDIKNIDVDDLYKSINTLLDISEFTKTDIDNLELTEFNNCIIVILSYFKEVVKHNNIKHIKLFMRFILNTISSFVDRYHIIYKYVRLSLIMYNNLLSMIKIALTMVTSTNDCSEILSLINKLLIDCDDSIHNTDYTSFKTMSYLKFYNYLVNLRDDIYYKRKDELHDKYI